MIRLSVLYPNGMDCHFDMNYYLNQHVPLIQSRLKDMGLKQLEVDEGLGTDVPDQPAPFVVVFHMTFEELEDLQKSLASHGEEIAKDVPNFTDIQPRVQISRVTLIP
jgi:uncharacterized protein (TIGR02118 family)